MSGEKKVSQRKPIVMCKAKDSGLKIKLYLSEALTLKNYSSSLF